MRGVRSIVASGDDTLRARIADLVIRSGGTVLEEPATGERALLAVTGESVDVAILDESMPGGISGSKVAEAIRDAHPSVKAVIVHRGELLADRPDAVNINGLRFERALLTAIRSRPADDPVRVFVVDDHEMVRRGLRDLAAEEPGIEIVGEAETAAAALEEIPEARPDLAVLDVRLPDTNGIELCREIRSRYPEILCLMFTSYSDDEALLNSILAGASGYLLKTTVGLELADAIRAVAAGGSLMDPATSETVMDLVRHTPAEPEVRLSTQQERVLELIVEGLTNREIAERLGLAEKTVKNYVSVILDKLKVRTRTQAAVYRTKLTRENAPKNGSG